MLGSNPIVLLFTANDHSEKGPASNTERLYSYLDRCGRDECFRVRDLMEAWFGRYPESEQAEFVSRIQSNDDTAFISSFFELYLHETLLRLGYSVEAHPVLSPTQPKRPDFLAIESDGSDLIVEAVLAQDNFEEDAGAKSRKNVVLDTVEALANPDFSLMLAEKGFPNSPPSGRKLRDALERWLQPLDADACLRTVEEGRARELPQMDWSHDGWHLTFTAWPRPEKSRGRPDRRLVGSRMSDVHWVDSRTPIRNAIKQKATRYGDVGRPYIVAVNALGNFIDDIDIAEALFGKEEFLVYGDLDSEPQTAMRRKPDGAWISPKGPINTRVSAALIVTSLGPWNVASRKPVLYHNPWAQHPCVGPITMLAQQVPEDGHMASHEGVPPQKLFDLPDSWPYAPVAA